MRVLVSGGAGYIGSHTVVQLVAAGHEVLIVDNFGNSKPTVVNRLEALTGTHLGALVRPARPRQDRAPLRQREDRRGHPLRRAQGRRRERRAAPRVLREQPRLDLLARACDAPPRRRQARLQLAPPRSTAPTARRSPRTCRPRRPTRTAGPRSCIEQILRDVAAADPSLRFALLRYFNPVGAHASGTIGEDPQGIPNNLMPFIAQVAVGRRDKLRVFGDDYPTPDGTALRDYIHVEDLAAGHLAALPSWARSTSPSRRGTSAPVTARASSRCCTRSSGPSGRELPYGSSADAPATCAESFADPAAPTPSSAGARSATIDDMCVDPWRWQSANPTGYPDA